MKKLEPVVMPSSEVIKLLSEGLSIDMLARRMAGVEGTGVRKARDRVMGIIYEEQMKKRGGGLDA